MFAEHAAAHLHTPYFALQSAYDSWQTGHVQGPGGQEKTRVLGKNISGRATEVLSSVSWFLRVASELVLVNLWVSSDRFDLQTRGLEADLALKPDSGAFLDSCLHHCGSWNSIRIDGDLVSKAMQPLGHLKHIIYAQGPRYKLRG